MSPVNYFVSKRAHKRDGWHFVPLGLALVAACGWPRALPDVVEPGRGLGAVTYPDVSAPGTAPEGGKYDAAVIVAVEDYRYLGERIGAQVIAGAWYRYFRQTRGVRARRIVLLRNDQATPKRIARAVEAARFKIHRRGTLWFIFVGHISSEKPGSFGDLWLRDGDGTLASTEAHAFPIANVLDRAAYGTHPRTVVVLDGCLEGAKGAGGAPHSGTSTPAIPPFRRAGKVDDGQFMGSSGNGSNGSVAAAAALEELFRVLADTARSRREPSDVAVFSSGVGPGCVEHLPGTRFPALAYLVLGALRGWADQNRDGSVTSVEVLTQVTLMLRAATRAPSSSRPRPSLYGANIQLARGVAEAGPTLAQLSAGRDAPVASQLLAEPVLWDRDTMVRFDRGLFRMGCPRRDDPDCERDERPSYRVRLSRYFLDPQEVTQAEYQACVDAGICSASDASRCFVWADHAFERGGKLPETMRGASHPAVCVTWFQARLYCAAVGKRLPTEAEWERAAAGPLRRTYPWGDAAPTCSRAHFDGCGEHTRPVGGRPAGSTPEGIQDLAGNVSEWVQDWYERDAYWLPFRQDPAGPEQGLVRGVRGGSYYDGSSQLRAAYRYGLNPGSSFSTVGFRCAR